MEIERFLKLPDLFRSQAGCALFAEKFMIGSNQAAPFLLPFPFGNT
jgi:hypothetical protein